MRKLRATSLLTLVLLLALGVSGAAKEKIVVWHSMDQLHGEPALNAITDEFRKAYPDIEVELINQGSYNATLQKLQVAYAGGASPNISMLEQTRSAVFYYSGALQSIDAYINGPNGTNIKDFSPSMLGAVTYEGKIYGLPYNTSTPLIYYNKDLFLKSGLAPNAPKTWNDILAFSKKIAKDTNADGKPDVYGIDFYNWGWLFEGWIGQNGGRVLNDATTEFTLNSPQAVEAMQFVQDLVHRYNVAYYAGSSGYNLFWAGNLGMTERSTASLADNISKATFDMGVAPLACNKECYAAIGGGNFFMMNTGTKAQRDAAWEYLKWITNSENLAQMSVATGYMSARRSSVNAPALRELFRKEPRYRATYDQMEVAYSRPKVPFWEDTIVPEMGKFYNTQFKENGNIKQALDELARVANIKMKEWLARK